MAPTNTNGDSSANPQAGQREPATAADENTPLLARGAGGEDAGPRFSAQVRKLKRKRWISFTIAIFLVALVVILTLVFGVFRSRKMHAQNALCLTPACIHAASEILYNLSPNYQKIDPCSNFQELVCDGWRNHHDMRPDQGSLSTFTTMAETGQTTLRHILEGSYPGTSNHSNFSPVRLSIQSSGTDEDNFNEIQKAYNTCIAETEIKKAGITPVQNLLGDITKIFASNGTGGTAISDAILYLEKLNMDSLLSVGVDPDDKSPDTIVVMAGPRSRIGLPSKSYYQNKDTVSQYQSVIAQVFKAVLPSAAMASAADKLAAAVVDLESQIAAATPDLEDLQDVTKSYNPMSLIDTAALAPALGLDHVLQSLAPPNFKIDVVITSFPDFFKNMSKIISSTSSDTLQAFFSWKVIAATANWIEASEIKPYTQFANKLSGKDPDATPERWRTCVSHVDNGLGWILSRFYVEAAFSAKSKDLGNQIVSDIKEQFITKIGTLDWMDDEVKKLATEKVNAIVQKIGYPSKSPDIMDPPSLKSYYAGLNISSSYFDNMASINRWSVSREWAKLGKPTNRDEWGMTAPTVNAYYSPPGNEIVFPAGIMQFPVFDGDLPKYINYGAFGAVAGHELSHAFDNNGRHYDVHGNFSDWWTNHTIEGFETRAECFVKEYSNFTVVGTNGTILHVNGRQTLGENIADAGGLSAAYTVWQKRRQDYPDQDLPGLDYFSQEQLFYVSYGNFWCSKYSQQALTQAIYTDPHSPNFARIQGTAMLNSRGFREAFSCPVKEPVCELW